MENKLNTLLGGFDNDIIKPIKTTGVNVTISKLNPDKIASILFYLHNTAHSLHLATTSYSKHKMLDDLYNKLIDFKDVISEYLLGIQAPKRLKIKNYKEIPDYSDKIVASFLQEGFDFTVELCEYSDLQKLEELCNYSADLQGVFAKAIYLNTLS